MQEVWEVIVVELKVMCRFFSYCFLPAEHDNLIQIQIKLASSPPILQHGKSGQRHPK
jgi:hypothetical protein